MKRLFGMVLAVVLMFVVVGGATVLAEPTHVDSSDNYDVICSQILKQEEKSFTFTECDILGEMFWEREFEGTLYTIPKGAVITITAHQEGYENAVNVYDGEEPWLIHDRWDKWFGGPFGMTLISAPDFEELQPMEVGTPYTYVADQVGKYVVVDVQTGLYLSDRYLFLVEDIPAEDNPADGTGSHAGAGELTSVDTDPSFDLACSDMLATAESSLLVTDYDVLGDQFCLSEYHGPLYTIPTGSMLTITANEAGVKKAINTYAGDGTKLRPENWEKWFGPYGHDLISTPDYDEPVELTVGAPFTYTASKANVYVMVNIYKPQGEMQTYLFYTEDKVMASAPVSAAKNNSTVYVDGVAKSFDAYTINDNNYFKLRDLAFVLRGTAAGFDIGWDAVRNAISLISKQPYLPVGGEMSVTAETGDVTALPTDSAIYLDGAKIDVKGYNINGSNYFKLRDLGDCLGFQVNWDYETASIHINSGSR